MCCSAFMCLQILTTICVAAQHHYMKEEIHFPIENDIIFPGENRHSHNSATSSTHPSTTTQYFRELSSIERELIAHFERSGKNNEERSRRRSQSKLSHPGEPFPQPSGGRKKHKRRGARRLCEIKYSEYVQRIFPGDEDTVADAEDADFDGRELAKPGEYPHMAAVGFVMDEGITPVDYKCGGSLISEKFVLTAAHCTLINGMKPSKVRFGDLNLMIDEGSVDPQTRNIQNIFNQPTYRNERYYNDIALLELDREIRLTEFVRPIRLWITTEIPTTIAFAMGYGATAFAKPTTHRLTNLNVTIVPNDECNSELPTLTEAPNGIINSQICAHDYILNRDTCQGDSGGPLQLNLPGRRKKHRIHYHLIGITSYGVFCRSAYPSVYTRVSSYLDWIESVVWE